MPVDDTRRHGGRRSMTLHTSPIFSEFICYAAEEGRKAEN
jgi:hypothetical protein